MDENEQGKWETLLFYGIPLLFTAIIIVIILYFFGVPVLKTVQDWGNKIPVINHIIPDSSSEKSEMPDTSVSWRQKYLRNKEESNVKDQKIADLTKQLRSNQKSIEDLQKQVNTQQSEEFQVQMEKVAGIYADLPPSKAAAMIDSMSLEDASLTISVLDQDQQSSILGLIKDPKKGAQLTMMIREIGMLKESDQSLLKKQIHELALKKVDPFDILATTIAGLPPAQAGIVIQSMMRSNAQIAIDLLKNMNTTNRSQILTAIAKVNAKLAAQLSANLN